MGRPKAGELELISSQRTIRVPRFVSDALLKGCGKRRAGVDTKTEPNRFGVMFRRPAADPEGPGDDDIRLPLGEQPGYFALAWR